MVVNKFSKTGSYHEKNGKENQDYLYSIEGRDYMAIMLADGATACEMGREGARLSCEAVAQVVKEEGTVFFRYPREKIAYLLTEQILYYLECNKKEDCDIREYGSTFALAYMEKKTGRTVIVNLGDGAVLSIDKEKGYSYLMRPKKFGGSPCLTTSKGSQKAADVNVVDLALGNSIVLCSDGFLNLLRRKRVFILLNACNMEGLNDELQKEENRDDCSYISFTRKRK